jgi:acyl dehydratase
MSVESIRWDDVKEGDELPVQTRDMTATDIVSMAIASRDFQDVHHDYAAARSKGVKDIFLNILSTGGLVGKYMTDWTGPEGELKNVTIKLGATVFPGDTVTSSGKVTKKYVEGDQHLVDVDYSLAVEMGPHAWGTATMVLPTSG